METHVRGEPIFDHRAEELLKGLNLEGFEVYWEKKHRDYEIIEREIAGCDALLAIVDATWHSSTWMSIEVSWANGYWGFSSNTPNPRMKPIPIFMYPILEREKWGGLRNFPGPMVLDLDVSEAISQIKRILMRTDDN